MSIHVYVHTHIHTQYSLKFQKSNLHTDTHIETHMHSLKYQQSNLLALSLSFSLSLSHTHTPQYDSPSTQAAYMQVDYTFHESRSTGIELYTHKHMPHQTNPNSSSRRQGPQQEAKELHTLGHRSRNAMADCQVQRVAGLAAGCSGRSAAV
jgi:hypothetical protein